MICREREWSSYQRVEGFKGTQMGPLLVLVCPCFRENVILTCKSVPFLCSLDNFSSENVIIFFFRPTIFDLLFTFLVTREKTRIFLQHIFHYIHTYIHVFCSPYWLFFFFFFLSYQFCKNYEFIMYGFPFGVTPCVDSFSRNFGAINKLQNGEQNLGWNVYYWYLFTLMQNL